MDRKWILALLLVGMAVNIFATPSGGVSQLSTGLADFCKQLKLLFAVICMVLVVGAAIVYAGGQMLGAETRARSNVWATAMITGAAMGLAIYLLVPIALQGMIGGDVNMSDIC